MAIAWRVLKRGATVRRIFAEDYIAAVTALDADHAIALTGRAAPTPWDPGLAAAMSAHGLAVHEEFVLSDLLGDLEYR